jgi:tetratricopeptide (TPR) repeat protein
MYVNLRAFDPAASPMTPAEAVRGFLDALGVPAQRIPVDLDAQAALYRSLLADRRILVVLDNARDAHQVRPLLPGGPGCAVVITSRNRLTGLITTDGAHPIGIDLLDAAEARELLAQRIGASRVEAESDAVTELIARCARLPLALSVVAARAAVLHRSYSLATLAAQLRAADRGLDAFDDEDPAGDVRAVFSWSYRQLPAAPARLFRLLGLHPGPEIGPAAAASLAATTVPPARQMLAELSRMHLLTEPAPDRYGLHDLLRAYAAELVGGGENETERAAAVRRMLDHYLHTAHAADRLLDPHRHPITLERAEPGVEPEQITGHQQALDWFTTEHPVLLTAVQQAAQTSFDGHAWRLAWALEDFMDRQGHWHDWGRIHQTALAAAQRSADPEGQAHAHRGLALAQARLGQLANAQIHLRRALNLFDALGQQTNQARTSLSLGLLMERQGDYHAALRHTRWGLDLYRTVNNRSGQAIALNSIGWYLAQLGDHRQALTHCQQALVLHEQVDDRWGQAAAWDSLGYISHMLNQHREAIACYRRALDLFVELSDKYEQAATLGRLGDVHQAIGDVTAAGDSWRAAREILCQLGHPAAGEADAKLRNLGAVRRGPRPAGGAGQASTAEWVPR